MVTPRYPEGVWGIDFTYDELLVIREQFRRTNFAFIKRKIEGAIEAAEKEQRRNADL
jgi:hypothetical protein